MLHTLTFLLALTAAPSAQPMTQPSPAMSGVELEQDARYATASSRSVVGALGGQTLGGLPTYGATAGNGTTSAVMGRTKLGGQLVDYYTITIDPGTGFSEKFIVYVPKMLGTPRPMVVAFHGFGFSQNDIKYNTSFLFEAAKRGWYLLAPLSASGGHFMSDPGMANTEAAMAWVTNKFTVDMARIYGVGFSMGGGMALNYGARHLDPATGAFAAIYNHSGAVDLIDTYENDPASAFVFDFWYGNNTPNSANYDKMIRSSVIRYDPLLGQVDSKTDLVRNLSHVPLQTIRASNDPLTGLSLQSDRLDAHLQTLGRTPGPEYGYQIVPGDLHSWKTIDEKAACDWLSQFSLSLPTSQRTLAASTGTYFHYYIEQTDPLKLTPFTWDADPIANELRLSETANLTRITVDTLSAGLQTNQPLNVVTTTADGKVSKIALRGFAVQPASVSRDGVVLPQTHWTYSGGSNPTVNLTEWDGVGVHTYTIVP